MAIVFNEHSDRKLSYLLQYYSKFSCLFFTFFGRAFPVIWRWWVFNDKVTNQPYEKEGAYSDIPSITWWGRSLVYGFLKKRSHTHTYANECGIWANILTVKINVALMLIIVNCNTIIAMKGLLVSHCLPRVRYKPMIDSPCLFFSTLSRILTHTAD